MASEGRHLVQKARRAVSTFGKGAARNEVDGFSGGLPMFDVLAIGALGAGWKAGDCGINGDGEMGLRH